MTHFVINFKLSCVVFVYFFSTAVLLPFSCFSCLLLSKTTRQQLNLITLMVMYLFN